MKEVFSIRLEKEDITKVEYYSIKNNLSKADFIKGLLLLFETTEQARKIFKETKEN